MQIMGFSPMVQGDPLAPLFMHKYIGFLFLFFLFLFFILIKNAIHGVGLQQHLSQEIDAKRRRFFFFFWFIAAQTTQGRLQPQHRHSGIISDAGSGVAAAQGQRASMALQRRKQRCQ